MFISVLSKHLPLVLTYGQTPLFDCMLEIVHLVESARYHLFRFDRLTSGEGSPPHDFQSGVDFGEDLDTHWRVMVSLIEFEAFLSASKRCLDHGWCCLAERLGPKASECRTLGRAIHKKIYKKTGAEKVPFFLHLKTAWTEWGSELVDLRNYVEHHAPLGGRFFGFILKTDQGDNVKIFIPDEIPRWNETPPKRALTFNKQLTANTYAAQSMTRLDDLITVLLRDGLLTPSLSAENK